MVEEEYISLEKLKKVVKRFENLSDSDKNKHSERDVMTKFIKPFLKAIGWTFNDSINEFREEKSSGSGFVDISLMISGNPKIVVECKKFGSLEGTRTRRRGLKKEISFEEQVFDYAYHLNVNWCILTNFEESRFYFSRSKNPKDGKIITLKFNQLIEPDGLRILKYFSKRAVISGEIDTLEKKRKRLPINIVIAKDLLEINRILIEDFKKNNPSLGLEEIQMCSQRIMDRLLIIRAAEDWSFITQDMLKKSITHWQERTKTLYTNPLIDDIRNITNAFDLKYNTEIFINHKVDEIVISDDALITSISKLYNYDFWKINIDILGSVYEEYLGHILQENKGKIEITKNYIERQKKGIFYTPPYVVRYIISKSIQFDEINEEFIKNLKVIDISCGSGTFIVESFNVLERYYETLFPIEYSLDSFLKRALFSKEILHNNIFGIDIDRRAAELASVNLSLRAMTKDKKLPHILGENILIENSLDSKLLIDNSYDFVIGNPPYIKGDEISKEEHNILKKKFNGIYYAEADYCFYFLKKGISLLKIGGTLGFIIAKYFLKAYYGDKIREFILNNSKIKEIIDLGNIDVFEGIGSRCCIIILEKIEFGKIDPSHKIKVMRYNKRNIKGEKSKIFTQIFGIHEELKNNSYAKSVFLEGFFIPQSNLNSEKWILSPDYEYNLFIKLSLKYPSLESQNIKLGEGGICGKKEIFCLSREEFEDLKLNKEMDLWVMNVRTEEIDTFYISINDCFLLYADHINTVEELDRYPKTKKYLLKHFENLAFNRNEFSPADSKLNRIENKILKEFIKGIYINKENSIEKLKNLISSKYKRKKNEEVSKYNDKIDVVYDRIQNLPIFTLKNKKLEIDLKSKEFNNFWKWWKWTRPQSIDIFSKNKILTPYISGYNKFMIEPKARFCVSAAVVGIASPDGEEDNFNLFYLLGLLNSQLYTFLHKQRAKPKDYRYEFFVNTLKDLPYPDTISDDYVNRISVIVKKIIKYKKLVEDIENGFEKVLKNNLYNKEVKIKEIWNELVNCNVSKELLIDKDFKVNSIAFKIGMEKNKIRLFYFNSINLKWKPFIKLHCDDPELKPILYYLYLSLKKFFKENHIAQRKKWRKGNIFSEVFLENIIIKCFDQANIKEFLLKKVPLLIKELNLVKEFEENPLFIIDNKIIQLNNELNDLVFKIFEVNEEEIKIMQNFIEYDIPYLPE